MSSQDLYDLSPALRLMLMGVVIALGPLAWVWVRSPNASLQQRLRVLTLVTLFITFDLVLFGAFTRLTDSGLGCPDWPGCYGSASPVGAREEIDAAQSAMPTGPVTHSKAWIEMIHRYMATGVGVLILTLAVLSWLEYRRSRATPHNAQASEQVQPWLPTATLVWVCVQGAFGALTVTMKLFPAIVTMHLLGGLVLLALLRAQSVRYARIAGQLVGGVIGPRTRWLLLLAFALLWVQVALGGWVSTNYAVLACTEFPGCQKSFWPEMNFREGFTIWRELGAGRDGANISFAALTAIHYVHRLGAYLVFVVFMALAWCLYRDAVHRTAARWLVGLTLLQVLTGVSNVVLGWPLLAAVSHTGGAAGLVVVLSGLVFSQNWRGPLGDAVGDASKSGLSPSP